MDDILITASNEEEHLQNLRAVFESIKLSGLRIKRSKCKFFQDSVEYLGHIVSKEGVSTSPDKVSAIADVSSPTDVSKLRSFLGMVNHYGKFIKNLTDLCAPLNKLLRKGITWNWTGQCQQNFTRIEETLISADFLAHFDPKLAIGNCM